jgi:pilus assembly protein CpaC
MKRLYKESRPVRGIIMLAALIAAFAAVPVLHARADKGNLMALNDKSAHTLPMMNVTVGKGEVVKINGKVADVMVANPSVADVVALQSDKLYIVGSQLGDTNLLVLDSDGNVLERLDIHVKLDELAIQKYLEELYPEEDVKVKALNDQVVLTGTVSNPAIASKITQVVAAYIGELVNLKGTPDDIIVNLLQVTGEQQVMLKVKIFEASKNLLKELGIQTELGSTGPAFDNGDASIDVASGTGLTQNPFALGALVFQDGTFGPLSILMSALEDDNMAHTLAEPNLTAISGQEAGFLAGGEFPVPGGRDSEGNVIIQFRSFGVSLNFRPTVLSENRISLQLNTEVSSLARDESVTIAGLDVPGLNIRRASTTVEVPSGGGLMIGGLLESKTIKGMAALPGIKDVPVLGDLISSRSFNREETELVVLVTAYLVKPYKEGDNKSGPDPAPQDKESPLAAAFADNIRRIYGDKTPEIFSEGSHYGYLID